MPSNDRFLPAPRWRAIAAIWSGIGLFDATQTVVSMRAMGMHHAWIELFVFQVLGWVPWALATPANQIQVVNGSFLLPPGSSNVQVYEASGFARASSEPIVMCQGKRRAP